MSDTLAILLTQMYAAGSPTSEIINQRISRGWGALPGLHRAILDFACTRANMLIREWIHLTEEGRHQRAPEILAISNDLHRLLGIGSTYLAAIQVAAGDELYTKIAKMFDKV